MLSSQCLAIPSALGNFVMKTHVCRRQQLRKDVIDIINARYLRWQCWSILVQDNDPESCES